MADLSSGFSLGFVQAEANGKTNISCVLSGMQDPVSAGVPSLGGVHQQRCAGRVRQARQLVDCRRYFQTLLRASLPDRGYTFEAALF